MLDSKVIGDNDVLNNVTVIEEPYKLSPPTITEEEEIDNQSSYWTIDEYSNLRGRYKALCVQRTNGRLMVSEANEIVKVKGATYKRLISAYGGVCTVIMINLVMIGFLVSSIYGNNVLL